MEKSIGPTKVLLWNNNYNDDVIEDNDRLSMYFLAFDMQGFYFFHIFVFHHFIFSSFFPPFFSPPFFHFFHCRTLTGKT